MLCRKRRIEHKLYQEDYKNNNPSPKLLVLMERLKDNMREQLEKLNNMDIVGYFRGSFSVLSKNTPAEGINLFNISIDELKSHIKITLIKE